MSAPPPPSYQQAAGYPTNQADEVSASLLTETGPVTTFGGQEYHALPQDQSYHGGYPPSAPPNAAYPPQNQPQAYPPQAYPPQPYPPTGNMYTYPPPVHGGAQGPGCVEVDAETGPKHEDDAEETAFVGNSFSNKNIRRAFIKKVYLILTAQLLVTVAFIAFFLLYTPAKYWVRRNSWFYYCSYALFLVTYIALVCCPSVRRKYPSNFICLAVFTLAFSYMTGTISSYYSVQAVLVAAGITALVCLAITIFAIQTKIDFTMCSGLLFALVMVLFFFGWACLITYMVTGTSNYILQCVYGALGALVFSLFLVYDTQMLMGGRKVELSPEEYIYGALQLYLDVVYIFLFLLQIFGGKGD